MAHPSRVLFSSLAVLSAVTAILSLVVWVCACNGRSWTLSEFLKSGQRYSLAHGFVYVNVSPPLDATTLAAIDQMDRIERDPVARRNVSSWGNWFTSSGGGDGMIFFGWEMDSQTRTVGPYTAIVDRRIGYWISPWLGVMPALLFAICHFMVRKWHRWILNKRLHAGRCPSCGYDLRATPERCPECGRTVSSSPAG